MHTKLTWKSISNQYKYIQEQFDKAENTNRHMSGVYDTYLGYSIEEGRNFYS